MTDKDLKRIIAIAERKIARGVTKEEALRSLQRAGHLDENGNFTPPYQTLAKYIKFASKQ